MRRNQQHMVDEDDFGELEIRRGTMPPLLLLLEHALSS
jgi:hypothetical protein